MSGTFSHELVIELPVTAATAWSVVADYGRDPDWRRGVVMHHEPAGLVRDGTRTSEELKFLGSVHRTRARIHDVVPGHSFRFTSDDGAVRGFRRVEPAANGCRVLVGVSVNVPFGPAAPIVGWFYRREVRGNLRRLANLLAGGAISPHRTRRSGHHQYRQYRPQRTRGRQLRRNPGRPVDAGHRSGQADPHGAG